MSTTGAHFQNNLPNILITGLHLLFYVMDICKLNTFMGIWQIFQTCNLVGHPIRSEYPENTNKNIRLDMNRHIWCFDNTLNNSEILNLMWTPM